MPGSTTATHERREDAPVISDRTARWLMRMLRPWELYFRYEVHGLDHVPAVGPALFVSPHSYITVDAMLLSKAIYQRYGRYMRGLGDHDLFRLPLIRRIAPAIGTVDGTRANARRLLGRGELCMCMPGGAYEAWKSSFDRYRLFWDGHYGFVRCALESGVPIIPTVCIGADDATLMPIHSLEWGERILGARLPIMPGLGLGLLPFPVKLTGYVGEPIPCEGGPEAADDHEHVRAVHARVVERVESMIEDGLARRRSLWR